MITYYTQIIFTGEKISLGVESPSDGINEEQLREYYCALPIRYRSPKETPTFFAIFSTCTKDKLRQ